jgi:2-hydroxyacyl-CoA lyase 1
MIKIGAQVLAASLKQQGVNFAFGIVGFPIFEVALALQEVGIRYIGMRNEQSAAYAAQATSYLTGRPQVALVVSGPGVMHALSGLSNAQNNKWPMLLIGGASHTSRSGMGAFQEADQVFVAKSFCKYAKEIDSVKRIPYYIEQAIRTSWYGAPGPVYLDLPTEIITGTIAEEDIMPMTTIPSPPVSQASAQSIDQALELLKQAKRPLAILGKGLAWARAEEQTRKFIDLTGMPFVPLPMAKGVVPDNHPLCAISARSTALSGADVVFLLGARFNWMVNFGIPPQFAKDVKVVQLDICPEEISTNVPTSVPLVGDAKAILDQLNQKLMGHNTINPEWLAQLKEVSERNSKEIEVMLNDDTLPMNFYRAFREIRDKLPDNAIVINEGYHTMDVGRNVIQHNIPRSRLDAGTYGTMGIGLGYAIAAALSHPDRPVFAILGDSAFGFSGMELETVCRHNLAIKFIILNNGGIGTGEQDLKGLSPLPPHALKQDAHYEQVMSAFGGLGLYAQSPDELASQLQQAIDYQGPALINVMINPHAGKKAPTHSWA